MGNAKEGDLFSSLYSLSLQFHSGHLSESHGISPIQTIKNIFPTSTKNNTCQTQTKLNALRRCLNVYRPLKGEMLMVRRMWVLGLVFTLKDKFFFCMKVIFNHIFNNKKCVTQRHTSVHSRTIYVLIFHLKWQPQYLLGI